MDRPKPRTPNTKISVGLPQLVYALTYTVCWLKWFITNVKKKALLLSELPSVLAFGSISCMLIVKRIWTYFTWNLRYINSLSLSLKMHLLELSTFSQLPSARFSCIGAFKHVGHWAGFYLKNDSWGSKSDETLNKGPRDIPLAQLHNQICHVYQTVNDMSISYYFSFRDENFKNMTIKSVNQ